VDETVLPWSQRMSRLVKVYGPVALGFHFGIEAVVFGGFYLAVRRKRRDGRFSGTTRLFPRGNIS
jgi:hypothetical protein